jgi:hypothetical protein
MQKSEISYEIGHIFSWLTQKKRHMFKKKKQPCSTPGAETLLCYSQNTRNKFGFASNKCLGKEKEKIKKKNPNLINYTFLLNIL